MNVHALVFCLPIFLHAGYLILLHSHTCNIIASLNSHASISYLPFPTQFNHFTSAQRVSHSVSLIPSFRLLQFLFSLFLLICKYETEFWLSSLLSNMHPLTYLYAFSRFVSICGLKCMSNTFEFTWSTQSVHNWAEV